MTLVAILTVRKQAANKFREFEHHAEVREQSVLHTEILVGEDGDSDRTAR